MAEAMMANRFFANAQGKPYLRTTSLQLNEEMAMVYIKSENNEPPASVAVPKEVLAPPATESMSTVTTDPSDVVTPSKNEAIKKFRETYTPPNCRKPKFQQSLSLDGRPAGCYSGTVHATHPSCVIVKFRIDKKVSPDCGLPVWPVEKFFDESMDESMGRKYLTRQYDIDDVLGAFDLWTLSGEEEEQEDISTEENAAEKSYIDTVTSDDVSSSIKDEKKSVLNQKDAVKTKGEGSHFLLAMVAKRLDVKDLTKVAKQYDTKDLVGILARCFDAPAKADVDSTSPVSPEDQNPVVTNAPIQVQRVEEKVMKVEQSGGSELALSLKQSQFARFPTHCPVTFKGCKRAEVKGVYYRVEQKVYTYRIKLEQSGCCLHVNKEADLAFAPDCPVIYEAKAASVVSSSSCGTEFSVKFNGDEVIHIGVSEKNIKFDPSQPISVKNNKATHKKRTDIPVKNNDDEPIVIDDEPIVVSRWESHAESDPRPLIAGKNRLVGIHQKTTDFAKILKKTHSAKRKDSAACARSVKKQKNNHSKTTDSAKTLKKTQKQKNHHSTTTDPFFKILKKTQSAKKWNDNTQQAPSTKKQKYDPAYAPIVRKEKSRA